MAAELSAPPVLSTPAEHTFDLDPAPAAAVARPPRTDEELADVYEIARTAAEIAARGWRRVALQFPDAMLGDAPWVVEALRKALAALPVPAAGPRATAPAAAEHDALETDVAAQASQAPPAPAEQAQGPRLYVLADTSYSACCVDEVAAEHADADAVVHYGRACLSPTSHLPVFYVFTRQKLDCAAVAARFRREFADKAARVVVMADVMFQEHVAPVCRRLRDEGYAAVVGTAIVRDPGARIPNRQLVLPDGAAPAPDLDLATHHVFHIAIPPTALLLSLASRLASLRIYPTPDSPYMTSASLPDPSMTPGLLRRRYGLVIRLATASVIGILVNTLSVRNYLSTITHLKEQIAAAGKKSYTIVVGKLNAAKLANFSEIDGWVVVGCWESGLVEQEDLWKPVITPFELGLAMAGDDKRVWDGSWWGGIEGVAATAEDREAEASETTHETGGAEEPGEDAAHGDVEGGVSDDETEPPEFDLRTGKLVFNSRPMRMPVRGAHAQKAASASAPGGEGASTDPKASAALVHRKAGELATVNGVVSPGAEYLRSQRTWQGLGSDFNTADEEHEGETSTTVEEGRSGVARGYTVGDDASRA